MSALHAPSSATLSGNFVAVAQERAEGEAPLRFAPEELKIIKGIVSSMNLTALQDDQATVFEVVERLKGASVLHLACHAKQVQLNPLESMLILHDGKLKISDIMKNTSDTANLVFLSACQTAMSDELLPDEALHIAGAMLFAGFKSAIATMW